MTERAAAGGADVDMEAGGRGSGIGAGGRGKVRTASEQSERKQCDPRVDREAVEGGCHGFRPPSACSEPRR